METPAIITWGYSHIWAFNVSVINLLKFSLTRLLRFITTETSNCFNLRTLGNAILPNEGVFLRSEVNQTCLPRGSELLRLFSDQLLRFVSPLL